MIATQENRKGEKAPSIYTQDLGEVIHRERSKIAERRESAAKGCQDPLAKETMAQPPDKRPPVGLAFSGGGIRSATFNLGLLQGLSKYGILPWVDYLTSVSGGGFAASCMTTLLSMRSAGHFHFDTRWDRFPFNPQLEVFHGDRVAYEEPSSGAAGTKLKKGHNAQLAYLRNRGNWLIPRTGWATPDVLRGLGGLLIRPAYTIFLFLLALFAFAALHYGLNAALIPSMLREYAEMQVFSAAVWIPPPVQFGVTFAVGLGFAFLAGLALSRLYRDDPSWKYKLQPWTSPNEKIEKEAYVAISAVRTMAAAAFTVLLLLTLGVSALYFPEQPVIQTVRSSIRDLPELAQVDNASAHFFWTWVPFFAAIALAAGVFLFRYSADDSWVEHGLPEQSRIDTLVVYSVTTVGLWVAALCLFGLRLQVFDAKQGGSEVSWLWLPAVFTVGTLAGLALFRSLPLRHHVFVQKGKPYEASLNSFVRKWIERVLPRDDSYEPVAAEGAGFSVSIWASPEFRSVVATLQGLAIYGTVAFALLALLVLPHTVLVRAGATVGVPFATAVMSAAWASVLAYVNGKADFKAANWAVKVITLSGQLRNYVLGLLVIVFNLSLIFLMQWLLRSRAAVHPYLLGLGALVLVGVGGRILNFNFLSPHYLYTDRIAEVSLKTEVQTDSGKVVVARDDRARRLGQITPRDCPAPYHMVLTALNLPGTWRLKPKDRKAELFFFSKYYCGSDSTGYVRTDKYRGGTTLYPMAIGLSGAAISPGLGFHTFFAQAFVTTLLNVRLGQWLTNPALYRPGLYQPGTMPHRREGGTFWPTYLWAEARAQISERSPLVNLTDGEHTGDGIGLYPLFQRRCQFIIAGDAGGDPAGQGRGLFCAIRHAEIDLGIKVQIHIEGTRPAEYDRENQTAKPSKRHFAVGRIIYPPADGSPAVQGWLIYFKSAVTERDPGVIQCYWEANKMSFPVPPTADQFFDEEQWEMQRALGEWTVESLLQDLKVHYEHKIASEKDAPGGGDPAKIKVLEARQHQLDELLNGRIDFQALAKDKEVLDDLMQALYELSNDSGAEAAKQRPTAVSKEPAARTVYRDAVTGHFVNADYARKHPDTTVAQSVRPHKRK